MIFGLVDCTLAIAIIFLVQVHIAHNYAHTRTYIIIYLMLPGTELVLNYSNAFLMLPPPYLIILSP